MKDMKPVASSIRYTLFLGIAVTALGLIWTFLSGRGEPSDILSGLMALEPYSVMETGLLLIIISPMIGVVSAAVVFARQKDLSYLLVSLVVLSIVILAILVGML